MVQIKSYQIPASISGVSSWISKCMELAAWRMTDSTWLSRSSADSFARADGAAPDGAAESWRQHGAGALSRYPLEIHRACELENHHFLIGKSTISWPFPIIYVKLTEGNFLTCLPHGWHMLTCWTVHLHCQSLAEVLQRRHLGGLEMSQKIPTEQVLQ